MLASAFTDTYIPYHVLVFRKRAFCLFGLPLERPNNPQLRRPLLFPKDDLLYMILRSFGIPVEKLQEDTRHSPCDSSE